MSCITEVMGPLPVSMVRDAPKRKRYFGDDGTPTPPQNTKNVTRRSVHLPILKTYRPSH